MIICKNCGAEYDDEQDRCPYCGGDNFGKSVQVHEDMMNELEREKKRWKEMPEKVAGPSAAGDRQHRAYRPGSGL